MLDPDQVRHFVGPDLGPNCLPRSLADDTIRQIGKSRDEKNHGFGVCVMVVLST